MGPTQGASPEEEVGGQQPQQLMPVERKMERREDRMRQRVKRKGEKAKQVWMGVAPKRLAPQRALRSRHGAILHERKEVCTARPLRPRAVPPRVA